MDAPRLLNSAKQFIFSKQMDFNLKLSLLEQHEPGFSQHRFMNVNVTQRCVCAVLRGWDLPGTRIFNVSLGVGGQIHQSEG